MFRINYLINYSFIHLFIYFVWVINRYKNRKREKVKLLHHIHENIRRVW